MEEVGGFWTRFQGKQRGKKSSLSLYKGGTVENWVFLSSQQPLSKLSCNNPHSSPPPPPPHPLHRWSTTGSLTGYLVYLKILRSLSTECQKSLAFKVKSIKKKNKQTKTKTKTKQNRKDQEGSIQKTNKQKNQMRKRKQKRKIAKFSRFWGINHTKNSQSLLPSIYTGKDFSC